jgi:2,3-diketo-5-methylthio-1-phosphopentane phosphatase
LDKVINSKKHIAVFSDFDGTITRLDIGDEIFKQFGTFEPYHSQLVSGELKISEYWHIVCNSLKVGKDQIIDFANSAEIDAYFKEFADYCFRSDINLSVISDGYDIYIDAVMQRMDLRRVPVYCNKLIFEDGKSPVPFFPGASESCHCLCASCKRNAMLSDVPEETIIVFIGDGASDYCAAEHADIIFAKGNLAAYCNENKLPHYPFSTFFDVMRIFKNILPKKLKPRNQARLLRKKAFETE